MIDLIVYIVHKDVAKYYIAFFSLMGYPPGPHPPTSLMEIILPKNLSGNVGVPPAPPPLYGKSAKKYFAGSLNHYIDFRVFYLCQKKNLKEILTHS